MLMTPAQAALPVTPNTGRYSPPAQSQSVGLRQLLQSVKRGPMWGTRQLDIFKLDASEPEDLTLFYAGHLALGVAAIRVDCRGGEGNDGRSATGRAPCARASWAWRSNRLRTSDGYRYRGAYEHALERRPSDRGHRHAIVQGITSR